MLLLNLGIITHFLTVAPEIVCGDLYHEPALQDIRLMSSSGSQKHLPHLLYAVKWQQIPDAEEYPKYMICIGGGREAEQFFNEHGISCLIFPDSVDIAQLISEIQDIFDTYHNLHTEYRLLLMTQQPMYMILDFCGSFMGNLAFLLDSEYSILETCSLNSPEAVKSTSIDRSNVTAMMNAIAAKIKERSQNSNKADHLLIEHADAEGTLPEFYFSRFFDGNQCIATLVVCRTANPFYPHSASFMQYLTNLLQPCMIGRYSPAVKKHGYIRKAINSLVDGTNCNISALSENLSYIDWSLADTYQLIYIRTGISERRHSYAATEYYRYENLFPDCIAVNNTKYACAILVVHNPPDILPSLTMSRMSELMTENKMECRISLPFNDFLQIKAHFDLVRSSLLNMGEQHESVSFYKDVMVKHIISEISEAFPIHALCHHAATELYEYDQQNNTELLVTLEKYLMYNRSIQRAGDELFIHRNTINYRLKKIEEITGINLNSGPDYLHLLLSCIVLRTSSELSLTDAPSSAGRPAKASPVIKTSAYSGGIEITKITD